MSTPEERLAALLRQEADTLLPTGDGLSKIQQRVAARRKARWFVIPSAALATAAAVTAFVVLGGSGAPQTTLLPPASPGPSAPPSTQPSPEPTAVPTSPAPVVDATPFVPAIWPFASQAQLDSWVADPSAMPWATSGLDVAKHFVSDYLKITDLTLSQPCVSCDVVELRNSDRQLVGTVTLVREDEDGKRAYSVAGVTHGEGFAVTSPEDGEKVASPVQVRGTITGVDEQIAITLLSQKGTELGSAGAPAGSGAPWSAQLTWTSSDWYTGALVLRTYDGRGLPNRLVVQRVVRA